MKLVLAGFMSGLVLAGCTAIPQRTATTERVGSAYDARASEWAAIVTAAWRQPDFVGSERTADKLLLGYLRDPERNLAEITDRKDVEAFRAPYSRAELDSRLALATRMIEARKVPYVAVAVDPRSGDIIVSDVENASRIGPFHCDQLPELPRLVEGQNIVIQDQRTCVRRP